MTDLRPDFHATPLDEDEAAGLILSHVRFQAELDELEAANILEARAWLFSKRRPDFLTLAFLKTVHTHMFGQVWKWAGTFRKSNKNIGIDWHQVPEELKIGINLGRASEVIHASASQ